MQDAHVDPSTVKMAVVVQRYVPAYLAGVIFTSWRGDNDLMHCGFHYGVGEELVSGNVTAISVGFRKSIRSMALDFPQGTKIPAGANPEDDIKGSGIFDVAKAIEEIFDRPQDIEFVADDKLDLHITQARPITTPT